MGYSISVVPQTRELGERMVRFMERHYRTWGELGGWRGNQDKGVTYVSRLAWGPLDYDDRDNVIGVNYKPVWMEREYAHALLQWVALRVGETRNGVPYFIYDGGDELIDVGPDVVDEHGWYTDEWQIRQGPVTAADYARIGDFAKPELVRLSKLWEAETRD